MVASPDHAAIQLELVEQVGSRRVIAVQPPNEIFYRPSGHSVSSRLTRGGRCASEHHSVLASPLRYPEESVPGWRGKARVNLAPNGAQGHRRGFMDIKN